MIFIQTSQGVFSIASTFAGMIVRMKTIDIPTIILKSPNINNLAPCLFLGLSRSLRYSVSSTITSMFPCDPLNRPGKFWRLLPCIAIQCDNLVITLISRSLVIFKSHKRQKAFIFSIVSHSLHQAKHTIQFCSAINYFIILPSSQSVLIWTNSRRCNIFKSIVVSNLLTPPVFV